MAGPGLPCVHCGLCLDTCPTYRVLGTEADSPRGRILLMEGVKDGSIELDQATSDHLDRCLGCRACESACPSGVSFGLRIEEFRGRIVHGEPTRLWRRLLHAASASPPLLRFGLAVAHSADRLGLERWRRRLPALALLPRAHSGASDSRVRPRTRSSIAPPSKPRARVALLTGCAGDVLRPDINRAAVEALHYNGFAVVDVPGETCCGALALHSGRHTEALALAGDNVAAFLAADVDYVVTTAAGCGAMVFDYARLLAGDARASAAEAITRKWRDISVLLEEGGIAEPRRRLRERAPVAYHDACHLLHAGGIAEAPRRVVEAAVGEAPRDLGDNHVCCGSAGSYNLEHDRLARRIGAAKAEMVRSGEPRTVAVGNVGCIVQLERALALAGLATPVVHPVELLAEAYRRQ